MATEHARAFSSLAGVKIVGICSRTRARAEEFGAAFGELGALPLLENPKGELQEFLQTKSPDAPKYHVVSTSGPDHDRVFECTVHHGGQELARAG